MSNTQTAEEIEAQNRAIMSDPKGISGAAPVAQEAASAEPEPSEPEVASDDVLPAAEKQPDDVAPPPPNDVPPLDEEKADGDSQNT